MLAFQVALVIPEATGVERGEAGRRLLRRGEGRPDRAGPSRRPLGHDRLLL